MTLASKNISTNLLGSWDGPSSRLGKRDQAIAMPADVWIVFPAAELIKMMDLLEVVGKEKDMDQQVSNCPRSPRIT